MTLSTSEHPVGEGPQAVADGPQADRVARRRLGGTFWLAIGWVSLMSVAAFAAPWLPITDPEEIGVGGRLEGPSWDNWFGTDTNGRDMFARTIWGARISMVVGFVSIVAGFLIGGTIGVVGGYLRGRTDRILGFGIFVMFCFPAFVLALLIIAVLGQSLWIVAGVLSVLSIPTVSRLTRAITMLFAEREFVAAARLLGATNRRVMVREILPNVLIPMAALLLLGLGITIVAEGGLAYLGLSVVDGFSWGKMIQLGAAPRTLRAGPWVAFFPIGAMFLTVLSLNLAGDRLRQYFDVRELGIGSR